MDDIVYRDGIPCKLVKDGYRVTVWESKTHRTDLPSGKGDGSTIDLSGLRGPVGGWVGTGQREVRVSRRLLCIPMSEDRLLVPCVDASTIWSLNQHDNKLDIDIEALEEKAERCRKKSQQRARRNCRHKIKHGGFRHMYTGTYRENQTDFDKARRDYAAWLRKVRATVPGFRAVWAFEPQKRGAWHFHAVAHTLPRYLRYKGVWKPSYEVLTLLWQDVVGDVQYQFCGPLQPGAEWPVAMVTGGTINVDGYTKKNKKKMHADARGYSLAKMAMYVSKYLTKDLAQGLHGRQMWGSTENLTPPKRISFTLPEAPLADILAAAFEVPPGHRVARHWLNGFGDCWVLDTEPIPA